MHLRELKVGDWVDRAEHVRDAYVDWYPDDVYQWPAEVLEVDFENQSIRFLIFEHGGRKPKVGRWKFINLVAVV